MFPWMITSMHTEFSTLSNHHDNTHLKADIYLLADMFETFCKPLKKMYELDPAHYTTLPGCTVHLDAIRRLEEFAEAPPIVISQTAVSCICTGHERSQVHCKQSQVITCLFLILGNA